MLLLEIAMAAAAKAGAAILNIAEKGIVSGTKADGSVVTDADRAAEALILHDLRTAFPDIPILAEEAAADGQVPELGDRFFLVDPLDGTKEFVNQTGEYTVNIALIEHGKPVAGVILAPALKTLWAGSVEGDARKTTCTDGTLIPQGDGTPIRVRPRPQNAPLVAVASRSHRTPETEALLAHLGADTFKPAGSSLKFCLVAEGEADVYPRLGRTMEWDTGAGQAILEAAGGSVLALDDDAQPQGPLTYGKADRGFDNPHFLAWGGDVQPTTAG